MNHSQNQLASLSGKVITDEMPISADDELLVAYLDNELPRQERVHVESRLVNEPELRQRLGELESGWEMLTEISVDLTSRSLVETTLEMAVAEFEAPRQTDRKKHTHWRPVTIGLTCLLACCAAYGIHLWKQRIDFQQQLEDMAIVQDLDAYARGSDIELLQQLAANPEWTKMTTTVRELADQPDQIDSLRKTAINDRPALLETMELDERMKLQSRWGRFERMNEDYRQKIRKSAAAIIQHPDREQLIATAKAYAIWREKIAPDLVVQIESKDGAMRRQAIQSALQQSQTEVARLPSLQLNEETVERIYFVLMEALNRRMNQQEKLNRFLRALKVGDSRTHRFRWRVIEQAFSSQPEKIKVPRSFPRISPLSQRELREIRLVLSDDFNNKIDLVANGDAFLETFALQQLVDETIRRQSPQKSEASLVQRFDELTEEEREQLQWLPADQILENLTGDRR